MTKSLNAKSAVLIGKLGEDLVAQWLQTTGWVILERRFSCRWGEIDIIGESNGDNQTKTIVFVEVKTRSSGNWDAGGREAIASKKQTKLLRTAEFFLVKYPGKADYTYRFDVAIVSCQKISKNSTITIQNSITASLIAEYYLKLEEYIPAAFNCISN
jgi:putative endonuclease